MIIEKVKLDPTDVHTNNHASKEYKFAIIDALVELSDYEAIIIQRKRLSTNSVRNLCNNFIKQRNVEEYKLVVQILDDGNKKANDKNYTKSRVVRVPIS